MDLVGYEITDKNVLLRVRRGNKEEVTVCRVGDNFFEIVEKEEGINLLFGLCQ